MSRTVLQRGPLAPAVFRTTISQNSLMLGQFRALSRVEVARPSFWKSIIPKFLRPTQQDDPFGTIAAKKAKKTKEWNPATFFIVIFLLIGSMSIQMIALKKDFATFIRRTDVRIGLLREVVEKLQRGERVDVEKTLGTGVPEKELEWEEGPQHLVLVARRKLTDTEQFSERLNTAK